MRILAIVVGFLVFFIGMIIVSWLLDLILGAGGNGAFNGTSVMLWVLASAVVTFLASEAARRIEPHFSLTALIVTCVLALLASTVAFLLTAHGSAQAFGALVLQTIGTLFGIWISFKQLRKPA